MAAGSRKARGGFWLPTSPLAPAALLLVESAIDALSAITLLAPPQLPPHALVASTAGVAAWLPAWLRDLNAPRTLCAYDADPPGDQAAEALIRRLPHCARLRPAGAKDWNDLLRRHPPA